MNKLIVAFAVVVLILSYAVYLTDRNIVKECDSTRAVYVEIMQNLIDSIKVLNGHVELLKQGYYDQGEPVPVPALKFKGGINPDIKSGPGIAHSESYELWIQPGPGFPHYYMRPDSSCWAVDSLGRTSITIDSLMRVHRRVLMKLNSVTL